MMHRNTVKALVVLTAAISASSGVFAQAAAPAPEAEVSPFTANVALTSNYKFRGQDQDVLGNNGSIKSKSIKPAIQGGFDYALPSGFYVGNWNSSVNWLPGNSIESDIYGGYKFKAGLFDLDFGVLTYIYPGNNTGATTELYGAATYTSEVAGAITAKYSTTVSKDYFGFAGNKAGSGLKGTNTGYLNVAYAKEVAPKLTFKAAVGYTHLSSDIRSFTPYKSYVDYNVGASYDLGSGVALAGSIQGANQKDAYMVTGTNYSPNKARFIVTLSKAL
jgi:uncharacterized protein (TIGR02001 family)